MKKEKLELKFFCLGHPALSTEMLSILGDKFSHSLPFEIKMTSSIEDSSVIVWDGIISLKMRRIFPEILNYLRQNRVLLLIGDSVTLTEGQEILKQFRPDEIAGVYLNGWNLLPEEILQGLMDCYQKIKHV
jgi:hypothetical protein